jgi:myo-inositol-hexaphosphate 3-phosphohydrolase
MTKEERKIYSRKWYDNHKEYLKEKSKKYKLEHKKRTSETNKQWYERNKAERKKYRLEHKNRMKIYNKKYVRDWGLQRKYGISRDEYNKLSIEQNNVCLICLKPETRKRANGQIDSLSVDHDHQTNKVRGLLCHRCNVSIGLFMDDPILLERARDYLIKSKSNER